MLQVPLRLVQSFRPRIPAGIFAATAVSTVVFSATPFLIPAIADDRDMSAGFVGTISTCQLAGFVLATYLTPRRFGPRRRMMVAAIVLGVVANLLSAVSPWFAMLAAMRFVSGLSLGLMAWLAWAEVFGDDERVGDVAVIGPIVGTIASPIIATVLDLSGPDWLFVVLGALYVVPAFFVREMRLEAAKSPRRERHRPTRAAFVILVALTMLTLGGSAGFVFAGAIGRNDVGLSPIAMSFAFSANAIAGVPSARYRGSRSLPGVWMAMTAVSATVVGVVQEPLAFWLAMTLWGFAFWMGLPGAFSLLAERSRYPAERAGDAQAVMAVGRVFGPLIGGVLYEVSPATLGIVAGGVMLAASLLLVWVEWRIRPYVLGALVGT